MTGRFGGFEDGYPLELLAENAFRVLAQSGDVAEQALAQLRAGTYDRAAWTRSVLALMDVGTQGCLDYLSDVLGRPDEHDPAYSEDITVAGADHDRELSVAVPLTRVGLPDEVVPIDEVGFRPAVLPAGATTFQVFVTDLRYAAANYDATIALRSRDGDHPVTQHVVVSVAL